MTASHFSWWWDLGQCKGELEVVERLFRGESYSFLEVVGSEAPCRAIDGGIGDIGGDYGVILG